MDALAKLRPYSKSIFAAIGAAALALQAAVSDGQITTDEWWKIGIAVLMALGVYQVENKPAPSP